MKFIPFNLLITLLLLCIMSCNTYTKTMKFEYVGIASENKGMHVWGSSPIVDKEGKIHLYAAQWPISTQTNFSGWYKDCEIGHYVSNSPEGPFKYLGVAVQDRDKKFNAPQLIYI